MAEKYRFEGEWPPISLLQRIPNWTPVLNEEDYFETTIKPEEQQQRISSETAFTAAKAHLADGRVLNAIVGGMYRGEIDQVAALLDDDKCWMLIRRGRGRERFDPATFWILDRRGREWEPWEPFDPAWPWLSPEERMRIVSVSLDDKTIFPLRVVTVLPDESGNPIECVIP